MEASPSDPSVSSIVLQSPERFSDRRSYVRVHIAENKKVQLSVRHLPIAPHNVDQRSPYQQKKNPSHKALFSCAHGTQFCSSLHDPGRLGVFGKFLPDGRVEEYGRTLECENQVLLSAVWDNFYRVPLFSL